MIYVNRTQPPPTSEALFSVFCREVSSVLKDYLKEGKNCPAFAAHEDGTMQFGEFFMRGKTPKEREEHVSSFGLLLAKAQPRVDMVAFMYQVSFMALANSEIQKLDLTDYEAAKKDPRSVTGFILLASTRSGLVFTDLMFKTTEESQKNLEPLKAYLDKSGKDITDLDWFNVDDGMTKAFWDSYIKGLSSP